MTQPGEPGYPGPDEQDQEDQMAKAPPEPQADPSTRAAELQAELEEIRAGQGAGAVRMQIHKDDPRSSFTLGGVTVGTEPSPVPGHMVTPLMEAAGDAGVQLIMTEE